MRSEYSQALRNTVEREMLASAFGWQAEQLKSQYVSPGEQLFKRVSGNNLLLWCVLVPHQKREQFTFEFGWSKLNRFPQLLMRPSLRPPADALDLPEYFVRLGMLSGGADRWWEIEPLNASLCAVADKKTRIAAPDALARVEPSAKDALAALESFGLPYLLQVKQND